jgi:AAA15 family ATPase/GTPase
MLISFNVSNYRSIGGRQTISLEPAPKQNNRSENILQENGVQALNAIAFYGPNSSGKSNLLKSIEVFDRMIYMSRATNSTSKLPYDPFLLREGYQSKPTSFEIVFVHNEARYRYGFSYNQEEIMEEWLYRKRVGREVQVFARDGEVIEVSSALKASSKIIDVAIEATRSNALFLAMCDSFNIKEAKEIFNWFGLLNYADGLDTSREQIATFNLLEEDLFASSIKSYLSGLKLGFKDLFIEEKEFDPNELPDHMPESMKQRISKDLSGKVNTSAWAVHSIYDADGNRSDKNISWMLEERESEGTKKAFHLSGPILYTLRKGGVLVIDEIEAKMHPLLTKRIISLFLDKNVNTKGAQLIFATHDTNILSSLPLRRDQINFVEKNKWESTNIHALSDIRYKNKKSERHDTDKEKRYLEGRYGGIPELEPGFVNDIMKAYGKEG